MKEEGYDPAKQCTLCGDSYTVFAFKGGHICESCLQSIKDNNSPGCTKK